KVGQRRQVAVHAEDAVSDDQPVASLRALLLKQVEQVIGVAVAVNVNAGAGRPAAGDQTGVVQFITEDGVLRPNESANDSKIGGGAVHGTARPACAGPGRRPSRRAWSSCMRRSGFIPADSGQ